MSPLAKVFVFLVTFLNICFLGVSATLYQVQKDWRTVAIERQAQNKKLNEEASSALAGLRGELETAETNLAAVKRTNTALETSNQNFGNANRDLKSDIERHEQTIATRDTSLQQKESHIQQLGQQNGELVSQNDRLRDEKEAAV